MKKKVYIYIHPFIAGAILLFFSSCSSNIKLEAEIIRSMNLSNQENGLTGIEIESLSLIPQGQNSYTGTLYTLEDGANWEYNVEVYTEGEMFEWKIIDNGNSVSNYEESYNESDYSSQSSSSNKCNLTSNEFFDYLVNTSFNINGNGNVIFSKRFDYMANSWVEGEFTISGNGSRVRGSYSILGSNQVYIDNVIAISGNYDASNNTDSYGYFELNCDGDLKGSLSDGNNRNNYTFYAK